MSKIALADELVKIIATGDMSYAQDYFNQWCSDIEWPSMANNRIKHACEKWGVDPARFGYREPKQSEDRIAYDWKDSE